MDTFLSTAASLPHFSAAYGHTYLPRSHEHTEINPAAASQGSEELTADGGVAPASQKPTTFSSTSATLEDSQLFLEALYLTRRHGQDYMDEIILTGEPGNFQISRVREDPPIKPGENDPVDKKLRVGEEAKEGKKELRSAANTPAPIQTDLPPPAAAAASASASKKSGKMTEKSPATPGGREKPKRRKSRPAVTPTES